MIGAILAATGSGTHAGPGAALPDAAAFSSFVDTVVTVLSWGSIAAGSFFILVGAIGLIRMPDMFTRMHAASIIDTIGAGLLLVGLMMQAGPTLITLKLLFILLLFLITSPVATHALAQAALHAGEKPELKHDRRSLTPAAQATRDGGQS